MINALTSVEHPCQALADALTIRERLGALDGVRIAWVGDGTNVLVSLAELATPDRDAASSPPAPTGYEPPAGTPLELVRDPREAVAGADVLVTDIWVSLGQEAEREARTARPRALPRRRAPRRRSPRPRRSCSTACPPTPARRSAPRCSTAPRSAVWDEAENRLHVEKALLALLVG